MTDDDDEAEILKALDQLRAEILRLESKSVETHRLRNILQTLTLNLASLSVLRRRRR